MVLGFNSNMSRFALYLCNRANYQLSSKFAVKYIHISAPRLVLEEPDRAVSFTGELNENRASFPYLTEQKRAEIWSLYKENPDQWPLPKLAQHFGTTVIRMKALLYLMRNRELLKEEEGTTTILPLWKTIYEQFSSNSETHSPEKLAELHQITEEEVKGIIKKMKYHTIRTENANMIHNDIQEFLSEAAESGYDTKFKEGVDSTKFAKLDSKYYPGLFPDEKYEEMKIALVKRIERETRADVDIEVDNFFYSSQRTHA